MTDYEKIKKNDKFTFGIFYLIVSIFLLISGICILNYKVENIKVYADEYPYTNNWVSKEWLGYQNIYGQNVWTVDGSIYYFSDSSNQYYLYDGIAWTTKVWTGLTSFSGNQIWTDGSNFYYSSSSSQYILDISTSIWTSKTWTGLTSFSGNQIWTDGTNIYYSNQSNQYVLDVSTSTWSTKTWNGLTSFNGLNVWSDGTNFYYNAGNTSRVLNLSTSTWSTKSWYGAPGSFDGQNVWTDGYYYYYSNAYSQLVMDASASYWTSKTWTGLTSFLGSRVWSDGNNIYYSNGISEQYILSRVGSSGGDSVVYSFNGANINIPTTLSNIQYGGVVSYNSSIVNFVDVKLSFSVDNNDDYNIAFDLSYIRTYVDANSVYGYSQSVVDFDKFSTSVTGAQTNSNILVFDSSVFGNSLYFYAWDSNAYSDNSAITSPSTYYAYASFMISISSNFTDYNFIGVRLYNDYVQTGNSYHIINHIRYFDADNEYIDISLPLLTNNLEDIEMYSNRYYYFNRNIDTSSETYQSGYDTGYNAGLSAGQSSGYSSGYDTGYSVGYSAGNTAGQSTGFDNGYSTGYSTGYSVGYSAGTDNSNAYTFTALIGAIIDTPISYFSNLWNFNLLGVNMLSFFLALFTLAIVLYVIKLILGNK